MKKHVITLAQTFSKDHPRAGEPTNFASLIERGVKKHTIRENYGYWYKRFLSIAAGEAVLSVREWTGKPYRSEQRVLWEWGKYDGIGLAPLYSANNQLDQLIVAGKEAHYPVSLETLAANDGLSVEDFKHWFAKAQPMQAMALIYFKGFRYSSPPAQQG